MNCTFKRNIFRKNSICLFFLPILLPLTLSGQINSGTSVGYFSGDIQVDYQYYSDDNAIDFSNDQRMGLNAWFNVNYTYRKFKAGVRYEAFQNPLIGYDIEMKGQGFPHIYMKYTSKDLSVTAGNFYEQFGNGIILRTYQDRAIGIDNSLNGIQLKYQLSKYATIKFVSGRQRNYFETSNSVITGGDVEIYPIRKISDVPVNWQMGFSAVNRMYEYTGIFNPGFPDNVMAYGVRTKVSAKNISIETEWASKDTDPLPKLNFSDSTKGNTFYVNVAYAITGFGATLQFKQTKNFDFRTEPSALGLEYIVSFSPPLAAFQSLKEFSRYPFNSNAINEKGLQLDLTYSPIFGQTFNLNYSLVKNYDWDLKYYESVLFEMKNTINSKLRSIFTYQYLDYNQVVQQKIGKVYAHLFHVDWDYRIKRKLSIRTEFQYLSTKQDNGDWLLYLIECSLAPRFSFSFTDEINLGTQPEIHYYNFALSYRKNNYNIRLNYGRQSEGYQCAGGLCRYVNAYKGFGASLLSNF